MLQTLFVHHCTILPAHHISLATWKIAKKKEKRTAREKYAPLLRNVVEAVTEKGGCLNFVFRWPKNLLAKGSFSHDNKLFNNIVLRFLLSPSVPHLLHKPTRRDLSARRQFTLNLPPREPPLQPLSLMWNAQCMLSLRFPMCILCMIQKILWNCKVDWKREWELVSGEKGRMKVLSYYGLQISARIKRVMALITPVSCFNVTSTVNRGCCQSFVGGALIGWNKKPVHNDM